MRTPTLNDVARAAGVSYSTADRVLNQRGGVADKSVQRVQRAIEDLDYRRDIRAANLSRQRSYLFVACVPPGDHGFFSHLRQALMAEARLRAGERLLLDLRDLPPDGGAVPDCDGIALVGARSERLAAVMDDLSARAVPVVTLVSDMPGTRRLYVGIDNLVAGRTAARLLRIAHRGGAGRILPVVGSLDLSDHCDRLTGAAEVLDGHLDLLPPIEVRDQPDRMERLLAQALADDPAITGIYSIGAGNRGLIAVMAGMAQRPFVVVHELTPHSRAALQDDLIDVVIDQKPAEEAARVIDALKAIADGAVPAPVTITPAIFFKDNLPGGPA